MWGQSGSPMVERGEEPTNSESRVARVQHSGERRDARGLGEEGPPGRMQRRVFWLLDSPLA